MRNRYKDTIDIVSDTSDAGDPDPDYTGTLLVEDLAANVIAVAGGEQLYGKMIEAHIRWVIEIRRRTDVTPDMQINVVGGPYSGETLRIEKVLPARHRDRRPSLQLHCVERDL